MRITHGGNVLFFFSDDCTESSRQIRKVYARRLHDDNFGPLFTGIRRSIHSPLEDGVGWPAVTPRVSKAAMKGTNLTILYASCVLVAVLVSWRFSSEKYGKYAHNFEHAVCVGVSRLKIDPWSRCQTTVFMLK